LALAIPFPAFSSIAQQLWHSRQQVSLLLVHIIVAVASFLYAHGMGDASPQAQKGRKRNLTPAQLAHKRELDRRAQRTNREKTKNRIAHLENLVESLRGSDDKTITFIEQIDQQKSEIERLQGLLNGIEHMASSGKTSQISVAAQPVATIQRANSANSESSDNGAGTVIVIKSETEAELDQPEPDGEDDAAQLDSPQPTLNASALADPDNPDVPPAQSKYHQLASRQSLTQMATEIVSNSTADGMMWALAAILLRHILANVPPSAIDFEHDDDIAIRAIFEGWGSVTERYPLDQGWQWLKEVDERIYFHRGEPFRLMHLRNCRLIFLRQMFRGGEWDSRVPAFFAPRPAEQNMDHDPLIEYFPWPGLRERMVFSPTAFATTKFMDNLRHEVNFLWSNNPHGLYDWDPISQQYSFSDMYHTRIVDIRCYPATADFFSNFPDLKTDIPSCPNALRNIRPSMIPQVVSAKRKRIASPDGRCDERDVEMMLSPRSPVARRRISDLTDGVILATNTGLTP
jgi:hypothetical protein